MANASPLTGPVGSSNDAAPDTTDRAELAAFCKHWKLDETEPGLDAFLDRCRASGTRWADWGAAWRTAKREAPHQEPQDELDAISTVSGITSLALAELGMPETAQVLGFADATVARIAANASTLATTQIAAGIRVPALKEAIRAKRLAARTASPPPEAPVTLAKASAKTNGNGSAPRP